MSKAKKSCEVASCNFLMQAANFQQRTSPNFNFASKFPKVMDFQRHISYFCPTGRQFSDKPKI